MNTIIACFALAILLYTACISTLALQLRNHRHSSQPQEAVTYIRHIVRTRRSLWTGLLMIGGQLPILFILSFTSKDAAFFGIVNLVCAFPLYGLWLWCGFLYRNAMCYLLRRMTFKERGIKS